jgi:lambda family phage portal protein
MNWLDRAIGAFSPERGVRRVQARLAMRAVTQAYEAAQGGRRTEGWVRPHTSADSELRPAISRVRAGARDLVRNNPYANKAVRVIASASVGTGIGVQFEDERLQPLWRDWICACDAEGQHVFGVQQRLIARAVPESGEVLARMIRRRAPKRKDSVPLQIQILEPDHLDGSRDFYSTDGGGWTSMGIEYDADGYRVAYWLFPVHPGESGIPQLRRKGLVSQRVPADQIVHFYEAWRPGQTRGVPWFAPSTITLRDLDEYEEAELVRKKIEACNVGVVHQMQGAAGPPIAPTKPVVGKDGTVQRLESFAPGMFFYLGHGEDVKFNDPKIAGGYSEYIRTRLHAVAAGIGVTYQQLTGDLTQTSYSSGRQGKLEFEALIDEYRWLTIIPGLNRVVQRWIDMVELAGLVDEAKSRQVEYQPPRFPSIDPLKDAMAQLIDVRSGFETWDDAVASRGYDPEQQIERIRRWNELLDAAQITLDSDPRKMTRAGVGQIDLGDDEK